MKKRLAVQALHSRDPFKEHKTTPDWWREHDSSTWDCEANMFCRCKMKRINILHGGGGVVGSFVLGDAA